MAGTLLGVAGKWMAGGYNDAPVPAPSTPGPTLVPALLVLAVLLFVPTSCSWREPAPGIEEGRALLPGDPRPGKPAKVHRAGRYHGVTQNREMDRYRKTQARNHRKPQNWH